MKHQKLVFPLLLFSIALLFTSCMSQKIYVCTEAFTNPDKTLSLSSNSSFAVVNPAPDNQDLFHKEVSKKIEKILLSKGYKTETIEKADHILAFSMGMNSQSVVENRLNYLPGGTITSNSHSNYSGGVGGTYGYVNGNNSTTTTLPGTYYTTPELVTYNGRWLKIIIVSGKDFRKNKQLEQLWESNSYSIGQSNDLRNIINYLLAANFKYFGKNIQKTTDEFNQDAENVQKIKKLCN